MDTSTGVVVIGAIHHTGLGIVRSLGRLGIPVYTVDADRWCPSFVSRYCRERIVWDLNTSAPERSIGFLNEMGRQIGSRPILIPTTDRAALWLADHAADLEASFRFPQQHVSLSHALCDKKAMQSLAEQHGIPIASTVYPQSRVQLLDFVQTVQFPLIVKAADDARMRQRAGKTKFIVHSPRALLDIYERLEDPEHPNLLIQEYIPGEEWMFNGYFDEGSQCLFGLTGRKLRTFPPYKGVTSLGVCLRNEAVKKTTEYFARAIKYRGILDIGFRRDARDGKYKVFDVNPRIGATFRLFVDECGMDVARALYLDLTDQPVTAGSCIEGRKWIVEDFDAVSAFAYTLAGDLTPVRWLSSLRGIEEMACFALDDPLPFVWMAATDVVEVWRKFRRVRAARTRRTPEPGSSVSRRPGMTRHTKQPDRSIIA